MDERNNLQAWMYKKGYNVKALAHELSVTENYIYKIMAGSKPIGNGFQYRFIKRFGMTQARKIFAIGPQGMQPSAMPEVSVAEPAL